MSDRATAINPTLLTWAREQAGLSISEVAEYMKKKTAIISSWESGDAFPTYNQLERLAEKLYRRPVALFFLSDPPDEPTPNEEFRTLPEFDIGFLNADSRFALRLARSYQESLRELTGGENPSTRKILDDIDPEDYPDVGLRAFAVREYLGISLGKQNRWRTTADAMAAWRGVVERAGIFVFKRSFKQREVSGFCLTDPQFPVIMINNSTPFTRQMFTLFHEIAHLHYGINSITTVDGRFVDRMSGGTKSIEVACNKFAAEILIPSDSFPWDKVDLAQLELSIAGIAAEYKVSREAILRRILDEGWVSQQTYKEYAEKWAEEGETERGGSGGSYYNNQVAYLGQSFLHLAFSRYRAGVISISDLSVHLGVKAKNITKLEDVVFG